MTKTALLRVVTGHGILPRPNWVERLMTMFDVRRTRIDLSRLSDAQLRDIGLTRDEVEAEIARPIWDVPNHWRQTRDVRC
ncbi:DUF1127 domain-containing protein [Paracoccus beibuensis]|uniref:DUF1127 domain-containing protein n=1 Tax=Paracoccus beibuensis TaxID=547602 RepID=UPI00223FABB1|nr:DUF1127 domain-containing protein [Paracoccus beibuensis]